MLKSRKGTDQVRHLL